MAGLEKAVTTQSPPDVKNYRERIRGGLPGGSYYYVTLLGLKAEDPKRLLEVGLEVSGKEAQGILALVPAETGWRSCKANGGK